jgi:hypothetical protein
MEEVVKRGKGRPRKVFTEEDKIKRNRALASKCMLNKRNRNLVEYISKNRPELESEKIEQIIKEVNNLGFTLKIKKNVV